MISKEVTIKGITYRFSAKTKTGLEALIRHMYETMDPFIDQEGDVQPENEK